MSLLPIPCTLAVAAALAVTGPTVRAQGTAVPSQHLTRPVAIFPEAFSSVAGLRELSSGTLVVSDRLEQAVRLVDLAAGSFEEIGRAGSGPGEYQMPGALLPLPGDSTLLVDFGNLRLTVIDPAGRFGSSTSLMQQGIGMVNPRWADDQGRLYFDASSFELSEGLPDSAPVLRWNRASDRVDTVGMLPMTGMGAVRVSRGGSGGSFSGAGMRPFAPRDDWAATPGGRVGIARASEYRVEWCDGAHCRSGPTVPFEPVRITLQDKEAWAARMGGGTAVAIGVGREGGRSQTMRMPTPDIDAVEWPDTKPPFDVRGVHAAPEGELWVQRHVRAGDPPTFDVFDATGRRVRQVILPADRRLVGFGNGVVYLVRVDEDDLQWLERYER